MAWLPNKAKNLFSKGKSTEANRPVDVAPTAGDEMTYHERKLSIPLESARTALLGNSLEQARRDPEASMIMEKAELPSILRDHLAGETLAVSVGQHGRDLSEEEHRLLTVFVLLGNGDAKFSGGYYTSAEAAYSEALKTAGGTKDKSLQAICQAGLAAAIAMQGDYKPALKRIESALRRKSDLAEAWYNKGVSLLMLGRYRESLPCFDEILQYQPDLAGAWYNRGVALGNLGRYQEALASFDKALEYNIQDTDAWLGKGVSLLMAARYKEALASFEEALRDRPGFAEAWLGRGLTLMMLTYYQEALSSYEEALRHREEFAEAWVGKGQALGDLGRHEEAGACFERALTYKPDFAAAWHSKGVALEKLGWWKQALAAFERARALEKGKP